MPKRILFDDDSEEDVAQNRLCLNKDYSEHYDLWRRKEDYQKLKDKYGDDLTQLESESSDEDGLADPSHPDFDMDFFRLLAAMRTNHPILQGKANFFRESYSPLSETKEKTVKSFTIIDLEKKAVLESDSCKDFSLKNHQINEDKIINKSGFKFDDNISDDDNLFVKSTNMESSTHRDSHTENIKKRSEALDFLKGKKVELQNATDSELLSSLKSDWEKNMSSVDKYLMDYFVNQRYLEEEDPSVDRSSHHRVLDVVPLADDEDTYERMEEYETKYRFRYEEPDEDFIRRYPRATDDVLRKKDTARKEARDRKIKSQKEREIKKKQEIERLKSFKRQEILHRISQLEQVAGENQMGFESLDLEEDFNPEKHDSVMLNIFGDQYYDGREVTEHKPAIADEEIQRELEEEYDNLERLDEMTEGSYRYVNVFPSSFGLSTEEIFCAKDTELNKWYSLKKILRAGQSESEQKGDHVKYSKRAKNHSVKKKVLASIYTENLEEQWEKEEERRRKRNLKKKERRLRRLKDNVGLSKFEEMAETKISHNRDGSVSEHTQHLISECAPDLCDERRANDLNISCANQTNSLFARSARVRNRKKNQMVSLATDDQQIIPEIKDLTEFDVSTQDGNLNSLLIRKRNHISSKKDGTPRIFPNSNSTETVSKSRKHINTTKAKLCGNKNYDAMKTENQILKHSHEYKDAQTNMQKGKSKKKYFRNKRHKSNFTISKAKNYDSIAGIKNSRILAYDLNPKKLKGFMKYGKNITEKNTRR